MSTRPMVSIDAKAVAQIFANSFKEHILVNRGLLNNHCYLQDRLNNPEEYWIVNEYKGYVRGVAALSTVPVIGLAEIERVCVEEKHRGLGLSVELCTFLVEEARKRKCGFVEAFARGNQYAMQRAFEKIGFRVYGVSPRFEIMHGATTTRELFVHMGLELNPETVDHEGATLIPTAQAIRSQIYSQHICAQSQDL